MKINSVLALLAIIGGITAAFTNHSERNNLYPTWKFDSGRGNGNKIRCVSASHLADLLFQKEQGITILDSRTEGAYGEYHIPSAMLFDTEQLSSDPDPKEMLVICGVAEDPRLPEILAGIQGKVYVLKGGIEEWYRIVLFPDFNKVKIRNIQKLDEILNRSLYFGGTPRNSQLLNITQRKGQYREGC